MTNTSKSNIFSNTYQTIHNLINEKISDSKSRPKWIWSSFPDLRSRKNRELNLDLFPLIVIPPITATTTKLAIGENSPQDANFGLQVEIWTTSAISGDTLGDSVYNQLMSNRGVLNASGVGLLELRGSTSDTLAVTDQLRLHQKVLNFNGRHVV